MKIKQLLTLPFTINAYISNDETKAICILYRDKIHAFINLNDLVTKRTTEIIDVDLSKQKSTKNATFENNTLYITSGGKYKLFGALEGNIIIDATNEDVELLLDNAQIVSNKGACISFTENCVNCSITALDDTENYLIDSLSNVDGVINCPSSLTFSGKGNLIVTALGGDGIVTKKLKLFNAKLDISATGRTVATDNMAVINSEIVISAEGVSSTSNSTADCLLIQGSRIQKTEYK